LTVVRLVFVAFLASVGLASARAEVIRVVRGNEIGQAFLFWDSERRCRAITALHVVARSGFGAPTLPTGDLILQDENGGELRGVNVRALLVDGDLREDTAYMEVGGRPLDNCSSGRLSAFLPASVFDIPTGAWIRYFTNHGPSRRMSLKLVETGDWAKGSPEFSVEPTAPNESFHQTMSGGTVYVERPNTITGRAEPLAIGMLRSVAPDERTGRAIRHDAIYRALQRLDRSEPRPTIRAFTQPGTNTPSSTGARDARLIPPAATSDEAYGADRALRPRSDGCGWRIRPGQTRRIEIDWLFAEAQTFKGLEMSAGCGKTEPVATALFSIPTPNGWGPEIECGPSKSGFIMSCQRAPMISKTVKTIIVLKPSQSELEVGQFKLFK
jgi:hypothetical protein